MVIYSNCIAVSVPLLHNTQSIYFALGVTRGKVEVNLPPELAFLRPIITVMERGPILIRMRLLLYGVCVAMEQKSAIEYPIFTISNLPSNHFEKKGD